MTIREPQMTIQHDGYYVLELPPYPKGAYEVDTEILQEYCDLLNERVSKNRLIDDLLTEIEELKIDNKQWRIVAADVGYRSAQLEVLANAMAAHFDGLLEDHRECPDCQSSLDAYNSFIAGDYPQ